MRKYKRFFSGFIITYILIVIVFALLYTYFSNDFYYSLSNKEIIFQKEYVYIEKELENSIKNNFKDYYKSDFLVLFNEESNKEFLFNIDDLKIVKMKIDNDSLESDILITLKNNRNSLEYNMLITLKILNEMIIKYENNIYKECDLKVKGTNEILSDVKINKIFKVRCIDHILDEGIVLDNHLNKIIEEYVKNNDGNPSLNKKKFFYYLKYNFSRMLYLSMVTITTLGFGDIVPLTNVTRMLIGLESTIGVVILGWFVNKWTDKI